MTGRLTGAHAARLRRLQAIIIAVVGALALLGIVSLFVVTRPGGGGRPQFTYYLHVTGHPTEGCTPDWLAFNEFTDTTLARAKQRCEDARFLLLARMAECKRTMFAICSENPNPPGALD